MPRHRRDAQFELFSQFFRNRQTLIAQSGQCPGGAAELHDEQARLDFIETLQVAKNGASQSATFKPKVTGNACCPCVRAARIVFRCRTASALKWRTTSWSLALNDLIAARSCKTQAVSMMSCVVAPQ